MMEFLMTMVVIALVFVAATVLVAPGQGLMGDKGYSMVFDNFEIRYFVPDFKAEIPLD